MWLEETNARLKKIEYSNMPIEISEIVSILETEGRSRKDKELQEAFINASNEISSYWYSIKNLIQNMSLTKMKINMDKNFMGAMKFRSDLNKICSLKIEEIYQSLSQLIKDENIPDDLARRFFEIFYPENVEVSIVKIENENNGLASDLEMLSYCNYVEKDGAFYTLTEVGRAFYKFKYRNFIPFSKRIRTWLTTRSVSGARAVGGWIGGGIVGYYIQTIMSALT